MTTALLSLTAALALAAPDLGPNVLIFRPDQPDIQARIDAVYAQQEAAQFGEGRYALLFAPGEYRADVKVGFYTHVLGLGASPDDVHITGAVRAKATWMRGNATCNFWRAAENLSVTPTLEGNTNVWGVSQATAMRRVHLRGNQNLSDGGWSSGGFLADCRFDGKVDSGTQQQWLSRNTSFAQWVGASWNMVFVGCDNPPAKRWPEAPVTVVEQTPVIAEKPYLALTARGDLQVMVPRLTTAGRQGTTWAKGATPATALPLSRFHIARPETDTAATLNAALAAGRHLLLTPGHYRLDAALKVTKPGTIILGLGYATLHSTAGNAALEIADVDGVKLCGVLCDAGERAAPVLVRVGEPGSRRRHQRNPICLYDLYCRAGGAGAGSVGTMVEINSADVLGDNFWLWRAYHGRGVGWDTNRNDHGLVVNGDNVTIYGLFVEHGQHYQTWWRGNGGRVYFYQSEMPYDPASNEAWSHDGIVGYASYKVDDQVKTHEAWGIGVYCVFFRAPIVAETAIEAPAAPGVKLHHLLTLRLGGGKPGSGIRHVVNRLGGPSIEQMLSRIDEFGGTGTPGP